MKKILKVNNTRHGLWMDANVTFAQVDKWFGHTTMDLKMDIIYPHESHEGKLPCIVWICGGGWIQLDRHAHVPNLVDLARAGYVIASVDYRDSNYVSFPGQLEDIKAAIRFLRANADRYHIDPEKIGVMGESAGGHLTAMTAVTGDRKEFDKGAYLEYSSSVQAALPWYMPSDFTKFPKRPGSSGLLPESRLLGKDVEMDPSAADISNPLLYISDVTPPMLMIHGTVDQVVPFNQSEIFYDALIEAGLDAELVAIEGANHADQHFFQEEVWDLIQDFFDRKLK